jgi:AcrR family transcriptional regulator
MISEPETSTRAAQKARTRQLLLDAAVDVIAERGLDGATARAISDRAGVAAGTFFVHFPEVAALLDELLDHHLARSLAKAYRSLPDGLALVDSLVHVADSLFAGYAREPALSRAFLSATLFRVDPAGPTARRLDEFRTWALDRMVLARSTGELDPSVDLDVAFEAFFCVYLGLVIGGLRDELGKRRQRQILTATLNGLLGRAS